MYNERIGTVPSRSYVCCVMSFGMLYLLHTVVDSEESCSKDYAQLRRGVQEVTLFWSKDRYSNCTYTRTLTMMIQSRLLLSIPIEFLWVL